MSDTQNRSQPGKSPEELGHEVQDLSPRALGIFEISLLGLVVLMLLLMVWLFNRFESSAERKGLPLSPLYETQVTPPKPRLQVTPARDLAEVRAAEDSVLSSYGWVNRDSGIVRIPIERAIDLVAERQGGTAGKSR